jgi:transposase-like protein
MNCNRFQIDVTKHYIRSDALEKLEAAAIVRETRILTTLENLGERIDQAGRPDGSRHANAAAFKQFADIGGQTMPAPRLTDAEILRRVKLWESHGRSYNAAAKSIGKRHQFISSAIEQARHRGLIAADGEPGSATAPAPPERTALRKARAAPRKRAIWLLTAAQDETPLHRPFWGNLMAYAEHLGASVMVGGFTYQKGLFEDHSVRAGIFAPEVEPFLQPAVIDLAPGLVWYGRANILPTASDPLSGWDTQTRGKWMIAPHAKIALKSVATMPARGQSRS